MYIQVQEQILSKFKVNYDLITPLVADLQVKTLGVPGLITGVKDKDKEGIKCLYFIFILICDRDCYDPHLF